MSRRENLVPEEGRCYGCWRTVQIPASRKYPENASAMLRVYDGIELEVCAKPKGSSSFGHTPRLACKRKALEKAGVCPGCGGGWESRLSGDTYDYTAPGSICDQCSKELSIYRARKESERPVSWWAIKADVFRVQGNHILHYYDMKDGDSEQAALALLAQALGGHRVSPPGDDMGPGQLGGIIDNGHYTTHGKPGKPGKTKVGIYDKRTQRNSYGASVYREDAKVELAEEQAKAVLPLLQAFADAQERAFRLGVREGRSLLQALSSGKMTISAFDDASVRYEEGEADAEDED